MKKYNIIYADPPWSYKRSSGQGVAKDKYSLMEDSSIYNLPVGQLADEDCALICWVTFPKIVEGITAIQSWGFEIKTLFASWIKLNPKSLTPFFGIGSYTKSNCEVCLLATKGKMHKYVRTNKLSSVVLAPREQHSKKPDEVRDMIVELFGDLPRVELFARQQTEGWDVFGNEVEGSIRLE